MKKAVKILSLIVGAIAFFALASCGGDSSEKTINSSAWLDRYEEKAIALEEGSASDYEWTTGDGAIVTVENGKLVAQGVGETKVTGTKKGYKAVITVKVNDSGAVPHIVFDDVLTYVGVARTITPEVTYNGEKVEVSLDYSLSVRNADIATASGMTVTGVKTGETKAVVTAAYKGLDLLASKTLTVKPNAYIELKGEEEITLISADNAKVNQKTLEYEIVKNGVIQTDADITYTLTGDDCVYFEDGKVIAKAVGEATVKAALTDNAEIYCEFKVTVTEGFVKETFVNLGKAEGATLEETDEVIAGKGNLTKYTTGELKYDYRGWSNYWDHRIQNATYGGNLIEKYREGYRYFTYDMYLTNANGFLLNFEGGVTYDVPVDKPFRVDWVKILDDEGNVINRIKTNQWITVCYDLYGMVYSYPDAGTGFIITVNASKSVTYLANIGYRFDSSFIHGDPVYTTEDDITYATNDEFFTNGSGGKYGKADGEVSGVNGAYKYEAANDYLNSTLYATSSLGQTRSESAEHLYEKGKYLAFDLYLEPEVKGLYFAFDERLTEQRLTVGVTDVEKIEWLSVVKEGKLQHTVKRGEWQTVIIDITAICSQADISALIDIEFGLMNTSAAYINNVRYKANNNDLPTEYGDGVPLAAKAVNEEKATVAAGEGEFIGYTEYTNLAGDSSGAVLFEEVQEDNNAPGVFFSEKYRYITFNFYLAQGAQGIAFKSETSRSALDTTNEISLTAGEQLKLPSWLTITDKNGGEVTALQTQTYYSLTAYIEYYTGTTYANVTFAVTGENAVAYISSPSFMTYADHGDEVPVLGDTVGVNNCDVVLSADEGFEGAYKYVNWTNNDRDGVYFSSITDFSFFAAGNEYVTFDFYLTESVNSILVYSWVSGNGSGIQYQKAASVNQNFKPADDGKEGQHFYFFDKNKTPVSKIKKGGWYTVTMKIERTAVVEWQHVFFAARNTKGVNSVAYIKNVISSKTMPYEWSNPGFDGTVTADPLGFISPEMTVTDFEKDGKAVKKIEGSGNLWFDGVMSGTDEYGDYFASDNNFVQFDIFFESGNGFYLQTKYHAVWHNISGFLGDLTAGGERYFWVYDAQGNEVSAINAGNWYTIKLRVVKDVLHNSQVCYSFQQASVAYACNLKFIK